MMIEVRTFACGEKELRIERTNLQSGKGKHMDIIKKIKEELKVEKWQVEAGSQAD